MPINTEPAGLIRRLMAITYDGILLIAVLFCYSMLYAFIVVAMSSEVNSDIANVHSDDVIYTLEPIPLGWPYLIGAIAISASFFCYFWIRAKQTLGMRAWKLYIVSLDGSPPSITQCLIRFFTAFISLSLLGLGYLTLLLSKEKGTWHDRLSNTIIEHRTDTPNEP